LRRSWCSARSEREYDLEREVGTFHARATAAGVEGEPTDAASDAPVHTAEV